jgi:hypothetical protein
MTFANCQLNWVGYPHLPVGPDWRKMHCMSFPAKVLQSFHCMACQWSLALGWSCGSTNSIGLGGGSSLVWEEHANLDELHL